MTRPYARCAASPARRRRHPAQPVGDQPLPQGLRADAKKNTAHAAERDRPDAAAARRAWRARQPALSPKRLVFLDETWATTAMARRYGRARRGQRLVAAVRHVHWKTTTFIAARRHDGLSAPAGFDGAITGARFLAYLEQALVPTLRPGDVVVLDNRSAPKVKGGREAIAAAAAEVLYLPPDSPDLAPGSQHRPRWSVRSGAPIELAFAKLKALLRAAARPPRSKRCGRRSLTPSTPSPRPNAPTIAHAGHVPSTR